MGSSKRRPMRRLIEEIVFSGLVTACRLAIWPTRRSPVLAMATMEGTGRPPSALGVATGSPPSMTAMQELVVPRSIPMALGMGGLLLGGVVDSGQWVVDRPVSTHALFRRQTSSRSFGGVVA